MLVNDHVRKCDDKMSCKDSEHSSLHFLSEPRVSWGREGRPETTPVR